MSTEHPSGSPGALAGVRVLEVADGIAGPFAGKCFAAQGAHVVKIEHPARGDRSRTYGPFAGDVPGADGGGLFAYLNAGKESVALDIGEEQDREIVHRLAGDAQLVIASASSPAKIRSVRLTYDSLSDRAEGLVVTTITPFGMSGPLADVPGHDVDFYAVGGVATSIGAPDRAPMAPPLELSAYQAGLCAASASLLALFSAKRTGKGQHVDVSPLDAWVTVQQGSALMNALAFGSRTRRAGRRRTDAYPFQLMPAKDGLVCMIARDGKQWKRFLQEVLADPSIGLDAERYRDRRAMGLQYPDEVDALLAPWFGSHTRAEIFELCRRAHVPFSPVRTLDEVSECEQLAARGYFVTLPLGSGGPVRMPGAPYKMSATPWQFGVRAPRLGEHTESVLARTGAST